MFSRTRLHSVSRNVSPLARILRGETREQLTLTPAHRMPPAPSQSPTNSTRALSTSTTRLISSSTSHSSDSSFSTVSPDEVSHFNALASSWWDPQGPSRILHLMNPLRHDFIRSCLASAPATEAVTPETIEYLDIGCGGGIFAESAARLPNTSHVTAIDPSPEVLAVAKAHAKRDPALASKLHYLNTPIEELGARLPAGSTKQFDVVSVFEVIEHVSNPAAFLDEVTRYVKPGGWLVMSTIARTWMSWLTTNVMAEDILRIVPRGTHDWRKYINEEELRRHFLDNRNGWTDARVMGVVYIPGVGWKEIDGSEKVGNYFFAVRRAMPED
ncbi:S-adenosyl-L-methionine-dependent methyltransferase [Xylariaceae sp. FL0016]|nr:S-adenosyl-L-methionine-dependent methyltransferase [Xylariaceae sp. FL0016]